MTTRCIRGASVASGGSLGDEDRQPGRAFRTPSETCLVAVMPARVALRPVERPAVDALGRSHPRRFIAMPATSEKQRRFMGAELQRKREGKKTQTGMSEKKLEEFASKGKKKS
jgi:hypothetical protein